VTRFPQRGDRLIARVFVLALFACTDNPGVAGPNLSLENQEIVITTIAPDTVTVDTMVTVRITGSGFPDSSTATWLIDTTTAPGITTLSTTWKSSTEIEVVIRVSPDAALRLYSVRIRGKKGKQGIAVEKFRVVAKPTTLPEPFGTRSESSDINDSGVVVGYAWNASGAQMAVRWTPNDTGWSYTVLGKGTTFAVNNAGLIPRSTFDNVARAWHTWIHFPSGAEVDFGPVSVNDIGDNGTMIGAIYDSALRRRAAVWRQVSQTSWGAPETLPIPAGFTTAWFESINGVGDVVGTVMSPDSSLGVVWKFRNGGWLTPEPVDRQLPGGAAAINDAGAMAGWVLPCTQGLPNCYSSLAFWPSAGGARRILPTLYNTQGNATAINNANQVVGWALVHVIEGSLPRAALIRHAVIWFPGSQWPEDLGAIRLSEFGEAVAINNHGWVAGKMQKSGFDSHATVWKLFSTPTVVAPLAASRR
jgi:uncharacterized membrane protein